MEIPTQFAPERPWRRTAWPFDMTVCFIAGTPQLDEGIYWIIKDIIGPPYYPSVADVEVHDWECVQQANNGVNHG